MSRLLPRARARIRDAAKPVAEAAVGALTIAMLRPDVTIAGAYLDEWGMVFAAIVTAWSGVDYLLKFSASLRSIS